MQPQPRSQAYPVFSVLRFALTHRCGRAAKAFFAALPHLCIIVNGNQRTEKLTRGMPGSEANATLYLW